MSKITKYFKKKHTQNKSQEKPKINVKKNTPKIIVKRHEN